MLDKVDWSKYGVVDGTARDPRCENCMVHCGYDPSGALGTNYQRGDNWKNFRYNFWPRPPAYPGDAELKKRAFNGVSIGKGHLAGVKAPVQAAAANSDNCDGKSHVGTFCGSGDSSERDALLTRIAAAKKQT
jgi:hypothetical protein